MVRADHAFQPPSTSTFPSPHWLLRVSSAPTMKMVIYVPPYSQPLPGHQIGWTTEQSVPAWGWWYGVEIVVAIAAKNHMSCPWILNIKGKSVKFDRTTTITCKFPNRKKGCKQGEALEHYWDRTNRVIDSLLRACSCTRSDLKHTLFGSLPYIYRLSRCKKRPGARAVGDARGQARRMWLAACTGTQIEKAF